MFVNLLSLPSLSIHFHFTALGNLKYLKSSTRPLLPLTTRTCEFLTDVFSGQLGSSLNVSQCYDGTALQMLDCIDIQYFLNVSPLVPINCSNSNNANTLMHQYPIQHNDGKYPSPFVRSPTLLAHAPVTPPPPLHHRCIILTTVLVIPHQSSPAPLTPKSHVKEMHTYFSSVRFISLKRMDRQSCTHFVSISISFSLCF